MVNDDAPMRSTVDCLRWTQLTVDAAGIQDANILLGRSQYSRKKHPFMKQIVLISVSESLKSGRHFSNIFPPHLTSTHFKNSYAPTANKSVVAGLVGP